MSSAVGALIAWNLRFESRRPWGWLWRSVYLLTSLLVLAAFGAFAKKRTVTGPLLFSCYAGWHVCWAIVGGAFLAGDAVADRRVLELVHASGLPAGHWLVMRLASSVTLYVTHWLLRWPLYILIISFGQLRWSSILQLEGVLCVTFLQCLSLGLWVAQSDARRTRQSVVLGALVTMCGIQLALKLPAVLLTYLAPAIGWAVSRSQESAAAELAGLSLWTQIAFLPWSPPSPLSIPCLAANLALSELALVRTRQLLYRHSEQDVSPTATPERSITRVARPSRRCWDDALAWQAWCCHGHGKTAVTVKAWVYGFLAVSLLLSMRLQPGWSNANRILLIFGVLVPILLATRHASDCWQREFNAETLSTLALIPCEGREIVDGWIRGSQWLALPDLIWLLLCAVLSTFVSPDLGAPLILGAGAGLWVLPTFFVVAVMIPGSWPGVLPSFVIVGVAVALTVAAIVLGAVVHPWLGVAAAWAFACLARWVQQSLIDRWWGIRVEQLR